MPVPPANSPPPAPQKAQPQYNTGTLFMLTVLGWLYGLWLYHQPTLTGSNLWDAMVGVLLGVYICSRPVGNIMDMLYTQHYRAHELKQRAGLLWLSMNCLATVTGWATIVLGATRMVRPD